MHRSFKKCIAFIYYFVCICVWCAHAMVHVWKSENNSGKSVLSFYHVVLGLHSGQALHQAPLPTEPSCCPSPPCILFLFLQVIHYPFVQIHHNQFTLIPTIVHLCCLQFLDVLNKTQPIAHGLRISDPKKESVDTFCFLAVLGIEPQLCQAMLPLSCTPTSLLKSAPFLPPLHPLSLHHHWGAYPRPCPCWVHVLFLAK